MLPTHCRVRLSAVGRVRLPSASRLSCIRRRPSPKIRCFGIRHHSFYYHQILTSRPAASPQCILVPLQSPELFDCEAIKRHVRFRSKADIGATSAACPLYPESGGSCCDLDVETGTTLPIDAEGQRQRRCRLLSSKSLRGRTCWRHGGREFSRRCHLPCAYLPHMLREQ